MHQPSVAIPWAGSISILFLGQDRAKNRRIGIRPLISMILAILAPLIRGRPKSDLSSHHRHGPATRMMNCTGSQGHAGGGPHDRRVRRHREVIASDRSAGLSALVYMVQPGLARRDDSLPQQREQVPRR